MGDDNRVEVERLLDMSNDDSERARTVRALAMLDASLEVLGEAPAGENVGIRLERGGTIFVPRAVVTRPDAAPLMFVFGFELDLWLGGTYEWLQLPLDKDPDSWHTPLITAYLLSEVRCKYGVGGSLRVSFHRPGLGAWIRHTSGYGPPPRLDPYYVPFARCAGAGLSPHRLFPGPVTASPTR